MAFSRTIMQSGARLPLNSLVRGVLNHYNLALCQLAPSSFKLMASIHVLWYKLEFRALRLEEFSYNL